PLAFVVAAHGIGHERQNPFLDLGFGRQRLRLRHIGHLELMRESFLRDVERHRHGEDRAAVLDRDHAPRGEALAVADAVDLIDNGHFGIAAEQEIGVQRMRRPGRHVLDRAAGRDQRLADDLPAEHPLPARLRRAAAKKIQFERLEIEDLDHLLDGGGGHDVSRCLVSRALHRIRETASQFLAYGIGSGVKPSAVNRGRMRIMAPKDVDVLIAGGGFAGLTLAIALRQALRQSFSVMVADPALGVSRADGERASAIVAAARRLFETIGVWQAVSGEAQPILDMVVTDSRLDDAVRPVFLTFAGEIEPGEPFAHVIENRYLIDALAARARQMGVEFQPTAVANFAAKIADAVHPPARGGWQSAQRLDVELADGSAISPRLLVAADGARSAIRARAGIATHGWAYDQAAIVTSVSHERDHEGRAEEHFLPAGPFAILPLKGRRSSIVWTETTREA